MLGVRSDWRSQGCVALYYDAHGAKRTLRFLEWREFGVIDAVAKNDGIFALTESGAILHFSLPKSPRKQAETLTLDGQRGSPLVPAGFASSTTILAGNGEFLLSCAFGGVRVVPLCADPAGESVSESWRVGETVKKIVSDGWKLVAVSDEDDVWVASLQSGRPQVEFELRLKSASVRDVAVSARSMLVGVLGTDGAVHMFSLFDGSFLRTLHGKGAVRLFCVTHTSSVLVVSEGSRTLQHYDQLNGLIGEVNLSFEPDRIKTTEDTRLVIIEGERGTEVRDLRDLKVFQG